MISSFPICTNGRQVRDRPDFKLENATLTLLAQVSPLEDVISLQKTYPFFAPFKMG